MKHPVIYVITLALIAPLYCMQEHNAHLLPQELRAEVMNAFTDKLESSVEIKAILENLPAQVPASNNANNAQNQGVVQSDTNAQKIKIIMNDKQEVVIDKAFLKQCPTLNNMLIE